VFSEPRKADPRNVMPSCISGKFTQHDTRQVYLNSLLEVVKDYSTSQEALWFNSCLLWWMKGSSAKAIDILEISRTDWRRVTGMDYASNNTNSNVIDHIYVGQLTISS
jgi:hypothetical protein